MPLPPDSRAVKLSRELLEVVFPETVEIMIIVIEEGVAGDLVTSGFDLVMRNS